MVGVNETLTPNAMSPTEHSNKADDDLAAKLDEHDELFEDFAQTGDPSALADLIEQVTGVEVASVKVSRPKRGRRAAAG